MTGLEHFIKSCDYEFGSKNYDDDFHTDILFYRASCSSIKDYVGDCHDSMIAFHSDFSSTFYYSQAKTKALCQRILELLKTDDGFFGSFEQTYKDSCTALERCWEKEGRSLILQYRDQLACQEALYRYCWPFEILQTPYGIEQEIGRLLGEEGYSKEEIADILYRYEIHDDNVYCGEKKALAAVCDRIKQNPAYRQIFEQSIKHIVILLPASLREEIEIIVDKYRYLYYHGYADRKLPNLYDYLIRIKEGLRQPISTETRPKLPADSFSPHAARLLACYQKLSALKSIRRLAQLKNFYHLDRLIGTLARQRGVSEAVIRYMTPEEVIDLCETGACPADAEARLHGMIYLCQNGMESILPVGQELTYYESLLSEPDRHEQTEFPGKVACRGYVKGQVIKILRPDDATKIVRDSIILTHEGDPDLLPLIKQAGAVVCEQGGITCHMAIIAREYGIPCLIGVGNGVARSFKNGDAVEVDAIHGYLKRSTS